MTQQPLTVQDLIIKTLLRTTDRLGSIQILTEQLGHTYTTYFNSPQDWIVMAIANNPDIGEDHLRRDLDPRAREYLNKLNARTTDAFVNLGSLAQDCQDLKEEFLSETFSETLADNAQKLKSGEIGYQVALDNLQYAQGEAAELETGFQRFISMSDLAQETRANYDLFLSGDISGMAIPTGLSHIDNAIMGLATGGTTALAGGTGDNKSLICGQIAVSVAQRGKRVLIYPLEMTPWQVQARVATNVSGVRLKSFINYPSQEKHDKSIQALGSIDQLPITFANGQLSLANLRSDLNALYVQGGIDVVIIDFMRLMSGSKKESEAIRTENLAYGLQGIAQNYRNPDGSQIAFLVATEYSRDINRRDNPFPIKSDIKYGGEFAFSNILGIMRPYANLNNSNIITACKEHDIIGDADKTAKHALFSADRWIRIVKSRFGDEGKLITDYRLHETKGILIDR